MFVLSACGQNPPDNGNSGTLTKVEYAEAFAGVQTAYGSYINANTEPAAVPMSSSISDDDLITIDRENQMTRMTTACVQFVGFLENLCENETFEIKTDFQEMAVVDTSVPDHVGNYKLRIKMAYDSNTSVITSEVYCEDGNYKTYLIFEILFNFDSDTLDYFTITGAMGGSPLTTSNVNYFKFKNNTFKMLPQNSEIFNTYAESILTTCNEISANEWGLNLPDYSEEYVSAMLGN
jgi:hypothetical protein